jgi:hypothetical protein
MSDEARQKRIVPVLISPPPADQRAARRAIFAPEGVRRDRYHLPDQLQTASPVGYRTRLSFTEEEAAQALSLLSLPRPTAFVANPSPITEQELFESCSLGVLTSRQSTNFRGHRQVSLGPADAVKVAGLLRRLNVEAPVLDHAAAVHVVLSRPYRTPFTLLLTLIGHKPVLSLATVPWRIYQKKVRHRDDIPTIGYLQHLHVGILADALERAVVIASGGRRQAQVFMAPFADPAKLDAEAMGELEGLCGVTAQMRRQGWRIAIVAQEGEVPADDRPDVAPGVLRKLGANLLAFRSERIQPGINSDDRAPAVYQTRQDMDVPERLVEMAGRALYNAFAHWTGVEREVAKRVLLMERIDVLTPGGKERLRDVRRHLEVVSDQIMKRIPLWADVPTGMAFRKNAAKGRKAFALAGQRIYIGGLSRGEVEAAGMGWNHAVRASGAAAARGALVAEIMGSTEIPEGCDLLAGICLMAGPVNQNDIGKTFFGAPDLMAEAYAGRDPTSLLVWTLKAKTVADPIGNEQQLMDAARKGALVDLRCGPHELVQVRRDGKLHPLRHKGERVNNERAFHDQGNFVTSPDGVEIPGNRGEPWPAQESGRELW